MTLQEQLHLQYLGFKNQPNLWTADDFFEYLQTEITLPNILDFSNYQNTKHHRLGKLCEYFLETALYQIPNYEVLVNNLQIQPDPQHTLGELDFIINTPEGITHVELAYKFYLYNPYIKNELERWIGPNLKDAFVKKLEKLKNKQLPILQHSVCKSILKEKQIDVQNITQKLIFKAQLYIPLSLQKHTFSYINNDCIAGYYISYKEIDFLFPLALYHVPIKQNWLINPRNNNDWKTFVEVKPLITEQIEQEHSPLIWIKRGEIFERFFITFW